MIAIGQPQKMTSVPLLEARPRLICIRIVPRTGGTALGQPGFRALVDLAFLHFKETRRFQQSGQAAS